MSDLKRYLPLWDKWETLIPVCYNPDNTFYEAVSSNEPSRPIICYIEYFGEAADEEINALLREHCNPAQNDNPEAVEKYAVFGREDGGRDIFLFMPGLNRFNIPNPGFTAERALDFSARTGGELTAAKTQTLKELYPDLAYYFTVFDPAHSTVFQPLTAEADTASAHDRRSVRNRKTPFLQAVILILIAAVIVFTFIVIGISKLPGLESSGPPSAWAAPFHNSRILINTAPADIWENPPGHNGSGGIY